MNVQALGIFGRIAPAADSSGKNVVNLTAKQNISSGGVYRTWNLIGRWGRSKASQSANNDARTQLLHALGKALDVQGMTENTRTGTVTFDEHFLDNLCRTLGDDAAKVLGKSDFKIKNGVVTSGRPLTERRVAVIVDRARATIAASGVQVQGNAQAERRSIAELAAEQRQTMAATLGRAITASSRDALIASVVSVTNLNVDELSDAERTTFESAIDAISVGSTEDPIRCERGCDAINALASRRAEHNAPAARLDPDTLRTTLLTRRYQAMNVVDFITAIKTDPREDLQAVRNASDRLAWVVDTRENHNATYLDAFKYLPEAKRSALLDVLVAHFDSANRNLLELATMASGCPDMLEAVVQEGAVPKADVLWGKMFTVPAPENLNTMSAREKTAAFVDGMHRTFMEGLRLPDLQGLNKGRVLTAESRMISQMSETPVATNLAVKIAVRQFDKVALKDFGAMKLYDVDNGMQLGDKGLFAQCQMDFARCGIRLHVTGGPSFARTAEQIRDGGIDEFRQVFDETFAACPPEQRFVVGFGLTQAGESLCGMLLGNGGGGGREVTVTLNEDHSVTLTAVYPEGCAQDDLDPDFVSPRLEYSFRVETDGSSRLTAITVGGNPPQVES